MKRDSGYISYGTAVMAIATALVSIIGLADCATAGPRAPSRIATPAESLRFTSVVAPLTNDKKLIKGWGDEQRLAKSRTIVPPDSIPLEYAALARIDPWNGLGSENANHFSNSYQFVASIEITGDYPKLGLTRTDGGTVNNVYLMVLRLNRPNETWYARIQPANGGAYKHFTVQREKHDGTDVPGAARWIWKHTDETAWIRCGTGCCTLGQETTVAEAQQ